MSGARRSGLIGYDLEALRATLRGVGGDGAAGPPRFQALHVLARCESTNAEAARLARSGAPDGTVVIANEQTAGRGRQGRVWASPPGVGLYVSLIVRLPAAGERPTLLPLLIGVSVAEALASLGVPAVDVKWPNDVRAEGRKVCGVLCEWVPAAGSLAPAVVAGIGVNVNHLLADFPKALREVATSVRLACGAPVAREDVLAAVLRALHGNLHDFESGEGFPWARWRAMSALEGRDVVVFGQGATLEGRALRVDPDGALVVRAADGHEERVLAGDVRVRDRAALGAAGEAAGGPTE